MRQLSDPQIIQVSHSYKKQLRYNEIYSGVEQERQILRAKSQFQDNLQRLLGNPKKSKKMVSLPTELPRVRHETQQRKVNSIHSQQIQPILNQGNLKKRSNLSISELVKRKKVEESVQSIMRPFLKKQLFEYLVKQLDCAKNIYPEHKNQGFSHSTKNKKLDPLNSPIPIIRMSFPSINHKNSLDDSNNYNLTQDEKQHIAHELNSNLKKIDDLD